VQEKYKPIETNISFADASLKKFHYEEHNQILDITFEIWTEKLVKIIFHNVLYFEYKPGSFISEIYTVQSESILVTEAVKREYNKIPEIHSFKLFLIKDIDDFFFARIVCENFQIITD
jgi:hypothetical protein